MSTIEKEVTKYMITTDSGSSEALEAAENLVKSTKIVTLLCDEVVTNQVSLSLTAVNAGSIQDNLLLLIQELGEYLTNDDEFIRAKGRHTIDSLWLLSLQSPFK